MLVLNVYSMMYGALLMHGIATCWVDRFSGLRQYDLSLDGQEDIPLGDTAYKTAELAGRIKRDAYEHYLLLQEFVDQMGQMWSPALTVIFITSMTFIVYCLYTIIAVDNIDAFLWAWVGSCGVYAILLSVYCMAYANSSMNALVKCFRNGATPGDFCVIGGRESWLAFVDSAPAYWMIFGFAITYGVLYSAIGTFSAAFIGTIVLYVSSAL